MEHSWQAGSQMKPVKYFRAAVGKGLPYEILKGQGLSQDSKTSFFCAILS